MCHPHFSKGCQNREAWPSLKSWTEGSVVEDPLRRLEISDRSSKWPGLPKLLWMPVSPCLLHPPPLLHGTRALRRPLGWMWLVHRSFPATEVTAPNPGGPWSVTDAQNDPQVPFRMVCMLPFSGDQWHCTIMSHVQCGGFVNSARLVPCFPGSPCLQGSESELETRKMCAGLRGGGEAQPWCPEDWRGTWCHCHLPALAPRAAGVLAWAALGPAVAPAHTRSPSRTPPCWARGVCSSRPTAPVSRPAEAVRHRCRVQLGLTGFSWSWGFRLILPGSSLSLFSPTSHPALHPNCQPWVSTVTSGHQQIQKPQPSMDFLTSSHPCIKSDPYNKSLIPFNPALLLLGIYLQEIKLASQRGICTPMIIAALSTTAKTWKQPKCLLRDEWIKKMWRLCTMGYYSAIKENEILPFAATWMNLEDIMLSEISQTEKETNLLWYHSYVGSKKVKLIEPESGTVVARGWGGGGRSGEMLVKGHKPSVLRSVSSGDLMYSLVTTVHNTVLYTWNLLRGCILSVLTTHTEKGNYGRWRRG